MHPPARAVRLHWNKGDGLSVPLGQTLTGSDVSICHDQSEFVVEGLIWVLIDIHSVVGKTDKVWPVPGSRGRSSAAIRVHSPSHEAEQILWISSPTGKESHHPPTHLKHALMWLLLPTPLVPFCPDRRLTCRWNKSCFCWDGTFSILLGAEKPLIINVMEPIWALDVITAVSQELQHLESTTAFYIYSVFCPRVVDTGIELKPFPSFFHWSFTKNQQIICTLTCFIGLLS